MQRQSKKQWCQNWIATFGCDNGKIISQFYYWMGGNGKRPNMTDPKIYKEVVKKTLEFKDIIKPEFWKLQNPDVS
jgi:hypothetical protein